jgi:Fe2+ transport system protein FeoA
MGIIPGVNILMERRAPLGDPIEIKCKTFHISLRVEEAEGILVEVEGGVLEGTP